MTNSGPPPVSDEIDPELVSLARTRPGVGPLLVLSIVCLTVYLVVTQWADLRYWMGPRSPRDLGDAPAATAAGLPDNAYVKLRAMPDRSAPGRLRGSMDVGHRLMPVLGTSGKLWVHVGGDSMTTKPRYDELYTGRVRRLDEVAFAGELRAFVGSLPPAPQFLDPRKLGQTPPGAATVRALTGDDLPVSPDARVELQERVASLGRVTIVKTDEVADEAAARALLTRVPGVPASLPASVPAGDRGWSWELPAPAGLAELHSRLASVGLVAVLVDPKLVVHTGVWRDLAAAPDGVRLGAATMPFDAIDHLAVFVPRSVPKGASVLLEDDVPTTYWYVPLLDGGLVLASALLLWALARSIRTGRRSSLSPAPELGPDGPTAPNDPAG